MEFPFKGDETPLRHMEHAELITIGTLNGASEYCYTFALEAHAILGRPSTIRPGKPVYKWVFERLVNGESIARTSFSLVINPPPDSTFQAVQDISFNEKIIASSEATIKACESELLALKEVDAGTAHWWGSERAVEMRSNYLLKKMRAAADKIETLERQNAQLKKVLAKARR